MNYTLCWLGWEATIYHIWKQCNNIRHDSQIYTEEKNIVAQIRWEVRTKLISIGSFKRTQENEALLWKFGNTCKDIVLICVYVWFFIVMWVYKCTCLAVVCFSLWFCRFVTCSFLALQVCGFGLGLVCGFCIFFLYPLGELQIIFCKCSSL